jgi:signal recognition particle subunit SRP54
MLETISKGFTAAKNLLRKEATLTEDNIAQALKEVRMSLLEADVEFNVVKNFIALVKERSLGQSVKTSVKDKKGQVHKLNPSEHFIGICYEELTALMGPETKDIELNKQFSAIMMVGLQGSGKTTTTAKLARFFKDDHKRRPMLVAADIYRPGAVQQLQVLGERLGVPVFHLEGASPQKICAEGIKKAKEEKCDLVILDTAGRLAIDEALMTELDEIKASIRPEHTFLVIDAMIGQDAVNTASRFNERLDISGVILTKLDGDARGGAALSVKAITHKPISFLSFGEDLKTIELFRPEGLASRILGMGDVVSLAKDFEKHVDEKEAEEDAKRLLKGSFSFDDFIKQLNMMRKIGSFQSIMERIPGMRDMIPEGAKVDDKDFRKFEAMILSMTKKERSNPELLVKQKRRLERIAKGSGKKIAEVEGLIERFMMMRQVMQLLGKNPNAMANLPMFKNMGSAANIAKSYGKNPQAQHLESLFGGAQHPMAMNPLMQPPLRPAASPGQKKDKRKLQKAARKKNKKKK